MYSRIKNLWLKAIRIGSSDQLSYQQKIRLHTLNGFAFVTIAFVLVFSLTFSSVGSYTSLQSLPIALVMIGVLWFNANHRFETAKAFMVILLNVVILVMALADRRTGTEYILLASACAAILLFDNVWHIALGFLLALGSFAGYIWYDTNHLFVPDPTVPYAYMSGVVMLVSACAVAAQLLIFRSLVNSYAKGIEQANNKVVEVNKQLKASYEEQQMLTTQLDWIVKQKSIELQSYIDAINVHVYSAVTDTHGTILKVNEPLVKFTGFMEEELIGQNFSLFSADDHALDTLKDLFDTISEGKTWRGELKNRRKDGSIFWIDMVVIPLRNDKGAVNYFLTLALPITERKEAEEQKEKTATMLEDIAFRASHKVRGPIARIQGLMNLLDKGYIVQEEMSTITNFLKQSVAEMDVATTELTFFVNTHFEAKNPNTVEEIDRPGHH